MKRTFPTLGVATVIAALSCGHGASDTSQGGGDAATDASTSSGGGDSDGNGSSGGSGGGSGSSGGSSGGGSGSSGSGSSGGGSGSSGSGSSSGTGGSSGGSGSSSGGTDAGGDAGGDSGVPINLDAFYVATDGDDSNPGTLEKPLLTLAQAQTAMRGSSTFKTTYVRAGVYLPKVTGGNCVWGNAAGSSIGLEAADAGETWSFYPPDGYGSAVLDGQSTTGNSGGTGGNGTGCGFAASQVADVSVIGLQLRNYLYAGFWGWEATNVTLADNVIHDTTAAVDSAGGILLVASPGATIRHNYVYDVAYMGIVVSDNSTTGDGETGTTVEGNVVVDACTWPAVPGGGNDENGGDCGGIYFWSQTPSVSTNLRIADNYVRDVNPLSNGAGDYTSCCTIGIYLDYGSNGVQVTGNVITGVTSDCFLVNGGSNDVFKGNLCDLGSSGTAGIVSYNNQGFGEMTGNVFEDNVVVAASTGAGAGFLGGKSPPNPMTISNNAYFNYVGTAVDSGATGGAGSDANPTYVNPQVSCWAPSIAKSSPVLGAPVDFPGITGGWGPPGLAWPTSGTAPSWPHGC